MLKNVFVPDRIFTVSNVLSPEECAEYITLTENMGYTPAGLTVGQDEYMMAPMFAITIASSWMTNNVQQTYGIVSRNMFPPESITGRQ